jgi:hypothetical protein
MRYARISTHARPTLRTACTAHARLVESSLACSGDPLFCPHWRACVCVRRTALGGAWESGHSDREQYYAIYFEGTWVQELDNVNVRPGADFAPQRGFLA